MSSLDKVKDALTPALAEILEISKASFDDLLGDVMEVLGADKKRPKPAIKATVEKLLQLRAAAEEVILQGDVEKGERIIGSVYGALNSYQVIAANKAINEAFAAWRKIMNVMKATLKEVGPIVLNAIVPGAGAVAKAVTGDDDPKDDDGDKGPDIPGLEKAVADAEAALDKAQKSKAKKANKEKAIAAAEAALEEAQKALDAAKAES